MINLVTVIKASDVVEPQLIVTASSGGREPSDGN